MKPFLSFFFVFVIQFSGFSQIEDHWSGVCENVTFTYDFQSTPSPLHFNMSVVITNAGTTDFESYCDIFETTIPGVILSGNPSCYPYLVAGDSNVIQFDVEFIDSTVNCFTLDFKIKSGLDDGLYCIESIQFCRNTPLTIEEIDRTDMNYTSIYYDLLGRVKKEPLTKGFFIERRTYEDGYQITEKIYIRE